MRKKLLALLWFITVLQGYAQTEQRIYFSSITPSINTGQDYSPWLNDNLQSLITSVWGNNLQYIDVTLTLTTKANVSKLMLYDYEGIFTDYPVTIYAQNGTQRTLLGTFTGEQYQAWVSIILPSPVLADAIVIHKYGNNIPQKVQVFGQPVASANVTSVRIYTRANIPNSDLMPRYIGSLFQGSNDNATWTTLYSITSPPNPTSWIEYPITTTTNWRYLRYLAGSSSYGELAELEFYKGSQKLTGAIFGSPSVYSNLASYSYTSAFDGNLTSFWNGASPGSSNYAGIDTQTQPVSCNFTPTASISNASPGCGATVTLSATCSGSDCSGVSYAWSGNGLSQNGATVSATVPSANGSYSYTVTASKTGCPAKTATTTATVNGCGARVKIPIDTTRWYLLTHSDFKLGRLFDGNTSSEVFTGWGQILPTYEAYYPLLNGETMAIDSIRLFDANGSFANAPMTLSVITDQWLRVPIATFTGESYNQWVGPYPTQPTKFKLTSTVTNARYLVIKTYGNFPTEMQLYGVYTPPSSTSTPYAVKSIKLKDMFGIDSYEWDILNTANHLQIDENRVNIVKSFTGFRHFMDWEKLEFSEGSFSYNPTYSGGWNYDAIYQRLKLEGIDVLPCLKELPAWMQASWPTAGSNNINAPLRYGKDFSLPQSYIEQAKAGFQFVARYGNNTNLSSSLVNVNSANTRKIGLGYINYIECDNERDKWWNEVGSYRKGYQTAREYAANLSAFYDGHKNTMGSGVGVKNADPTIKVVIGGLASGVYGPDYVRGMIDWCKENRGYKADGSVNLCWDIINYHMYSDDASSSQGSNATRGTSPDTRPLIKSVAQDYIKNAHLFAGDMPIWVTETGYDLNPGSPQHVPLIGSKTALLTQADWTLRTSLFYARNGIEKVFFYQLYDVNSASNTRFASSGLANSSGSGATETWTRRPAADYLYQTNKLFGQYVYKETLSQSPFVDRYELNGKSMYAMVVPGETGNTASYTLNLGSATQATVYRPQAGANDMATQVMNTVQGKLALTVTETPFFIVPLTAGAREAITETTTQTLQSSVTVFPNPSSDLITVSGESSVTGPVEISIFDANRGTLHKHTILNKPDRTFSELLDLSGLPVGLYILHVKKGYEHAFRKVIRN